MNEQHAKKILFNKSTLLSLKAELLKKQEEVNEKKRLPQHKLENFIPPPKTVDKTEKTEKRSFKDNLKAVDVDEIEACKKAKLALEKKSELYDHLSDNAGNSKIAGNFLVDFNTKKQEQVSRCNSTVKDIALLESVQDEFNFEEDNCNEWTEFVDCLGRTRKCLKSDLNLYMQKDEELLRAVNKSNDINQVPASDGQDKEKPILVQKTSDYLQSLRDKWEEKEKQLLAKENDIHYQDVLFDEARIHGVGYYSFSTDEAERQKQMNELMKTRQETVHAQKEADDKRKKREELIAARVAAARARQRARAGLPPEDPNQTKKDFTTCLLEFLTQQKNEADEKAKEKELKLKEDRERERQKMREAFVREWDIGKDGVEGNKKLFREMTQEEYVEQQRAKRIDEFAPPQVINDGQDSSYFFDNKGRMGSDDTVPTNAKTWSEVRPNITPSPPRISEDMFENKGLYFSTAQAKRKVNFKNYIHNQEPTPIIDELSDYKNSLQKEQEPSSSKNVELLSKNKHSEIAPPPTYDYYGPLPKRNKFSVPFKSDLSEAYDQGAKSLESRSSDRKLPDVYDFTFD